MPLVRDKGEPNDWRAIRSEGSVPKNSNRIRVTAQLIYAQDGAQAHTCGRTLRPHQALCASLGSGGETGHQLHKEFGAGKLDGVDFQSVPTDEAEGAGYGFWRLDAALATLE